MDNLVEINRMVGVHLMGWEEVLGTEGNPLNGHILITTLPAEGYRSVPERCFVGYPVRVNGEWTDRVWEVWNPCEMGLDLEKVKYMLLVKGFYCAVDRAEISYAKVWKVGTMWDYTPTYLFGCSADREGVALCKAVLKALEENGTPKV